MAQSNTGQRKDVVRATKQAKLTQDEKLSAISGIMSVPNGRHWMYDLLEGFNTFHTPWAGLDSTTNFNCGVQSCGLRIMADILQACPDQYVLMLTEAKQREMANERRNAGEPERSPGSDGNDPGSEPEAGDEGYDFYDEPGPAEGRDESGAGPVEERRPIQIRRQVAPR